MIWRCAMDLKNEIDNSLIKIIERMESWTNIQVRGDQNEMSGSSKVVNGLGTDSLGSSGQQSDQAGWQAGRQRIIEGRAERSQQDERGKQEQSKEKRVVVEDGVVGCFIIGHLVLFPQNTLVFFVARQFAVGQFAAQLFANGVFAILSKSVFKLEFGIAISESDCIRCNQRDHAEQHGPVGHLHVVNTPVQP